MKKTILPLLALLLFLSCKQRKGNESNDDPGSIHFEAPSPGKINEAERLQLQRSIAALMDSVLLNGNFNGSILVAKEGVILYEKYQGLRNLRNPSDTIDEHTPIHLASTSKPFMSLAILRLVQENKLSLNDEVSRILPDFPFTGITISMLLSHRSGLPNYLYYMDNSDWDRSKYVSNQDVYNVLCRDKPEGGSAPDKHFSYSNTNYVLLALIVEKITGLSYPEFMKKKFFDPIGMEDTYVFSLKDSLKATPSFTATGKKWENDYLDGTYGDKNIYSTPRDLLKFDQALYTGQLIRKSLLDSSFLPQSHERISAHNYGLGWRMLQYPNDKKVIYHFGRWHGCNAAYVRLRDEKVAIFILGNRFTRMVYNAAHHCYPIFGPYGQQQEADSEESNEKQAPKP